ncbi:DEAD/DEAH box helicase [Paenibacillus allorhizosphaerae]|uniref:Transcription-repair-coupling factor n=1 Tax=Paenibacillus allorhizosphaerae TaxID=2849866 RepID=A0ABN7TTS1_9BACL|nr:helicase-related protein [Paenibacillus allorhizosphaerae]CAG7655473.1 Transcription-repair-coupling factor [Paenibacillus allorhizosphaerae]
MKSWVYAIISQNSCSWHVSLDMRADRDHWARQYGQAFKMRVMEPSLSFGQACELVYFMNQRDQGMSVKKQLSLLRHAARATGQPDMSIEQWKLWDWKPHSMVTAIDGRMRLVSSVGELMAGRSLMLDEFKSLMDHEGQEEIAANPNYFLQLAWLKGKLAIESAVQVNRNVRKMPMPLRKQTVCRCRRCGNEQSREESGTAVTSEPISWTDCPSCGGPCPCCEACLTMGRARYCSLLISGVEYQHPQPSNRIQSTADEMDSLLAPWGLSSVQTDASRSVLEFLKANETHIRVNNEKEKPKTQFLIWAVTGAGKTEMIFPMIQYSLNHGGRVAVATPRRDVVLELKPRLAKAFPDIRVVTLYGGSEQRWERGELTIATTHQLMRFRHAFDLVIIDEIDAFPYHNNPILQYTASQVCKSGGAYILLSATPPEAQQRAVKRGRLPHARVAARYHRHPLPVPQLMVIPSITQMLQQSKLHARLFQKLQESVHRGAQVFVFVPKIALVEPLVKLLRQNYPDIRIEGTSSKDEHRAQKVSDFRASDIRMLVTTTILERGVTIPKSDVFILESDSSMFDAAALVQMAGRAGRSAQDPRGMVYFAAREKNRSQVNAIGQIKEMNALARKRGHID